MKKIFYTLCLFLSMSTLGCAENVVWEGKVLSDGTPTNPIHLVLGHKYQIEVDGIVNLGKWVQNREELGNDGCYEFNKHGETAKVASFRNSHEISVCEGGDYHPNHQYQSQPFTAQQNKIHFWVYDINYDDNEGHFNAKIVEVVE